MPFPESTLRKGGIYPWSNGRFAFIVTLANELRIYSINPINRRLFYVPDLGMFQLNESHRYILGKSEVYLYHQLSTNPLNLFAIVEISRHLQKEKRKNLDMHDLAIYVDKIRRVEQGKRLIDGLLSSATNDQEAEEIKVKLQNMYSDGSLQYSIEKLADLTKPKELPFSNETLDWLNSYYGEDVVNRQFVMLSIIIQEKFRLKASMGVPPVFMGRTSRKSTIALVVINDRIIEVDPFAKVEMNAETGDMELVTKHFGVFKIREARTRYKYGKQAVYFVMVHTKKPVIQALEPDNGKAAGEQVTPQLEPPIARKAGRKPKGEIVVATTPAYVEHEILKGYFYDPKRPSVLYQAEFLAEDLEHKKLEAGVST